ncbi:MAG: Fis family transcriptional regulator, partial [Nitrospirota bacterium]|nr:Fis family transcriptional regulator [Nitrospirota bacterium]
LNLDRAIPNIAESSSPHPIAKEETTPRIRTVQELQELERQNIRFALEQTGWKVSGEKGAAQLLGMNASTLASRMKALGISRST